MVTALELDPMSYAEFLERMHIESMNKHHIIAAANALNHFGKFLYGNNKAMIRAMSKRRTQIMGPDKLLH